MIEAATSPESGDPNDRESERVFNVDRDDRTDQTLLGLTYSFAPRLKFLCTHEYDQRVDNTVATGRKTYTRNTMIEAGFSGNYDWGKNRSLVFSIRKAFKNGDSVTEAQEEYWVMNSEFKYAF